jgi:hypothetical protein
LLTFHSCGGGSNPVELADDSQLVIVRGGRFTVDRVPACPLAYSVRWRDKLLPLFVVVDPGGTSYVELAIGEPHTKHVHGTVRDASGHPVANARVTAVVDSAEATTVRADDSGNFTLTTEGGAELVAGNGIHVGRGTVGRANVDDERVDLVLDDHASDQ